MNRMRKDVTKRFFWHILRLSLRFLKDQLKVVIVFIICLIMIFILNTNKMSLVVKGALRDEFVKVYEALSQPANRAYKLIGVGINKLYSWYHDIEYDKIDLHISELFYLRFQHLILLNEIEDLKEIVNYVEEANYYFLTTRLISSVFNHLGGSFILGVGKENGVSPGNAVIKDGHLLGVIIEVNDISSRGLYVGNPNLHIPVVFLPSHRSGVIAGDNSSALKVMYLSEEEIQDQKIVVTAGDEEGMPYGLIVAEVQAGKIQILSQTTNGLVQVVLNKRKS